MPSVKGAGVHRRPLRALSTPVSLPEGTLLRSSERMGMGRVGVCEIGEIPPCSERSKIVNSVAGRVTEVQ